MEFLRDLLFGLVDIAIAGAMLYYWRRSRIPAVVILAAGLALLALPIAIVISRAWYMSSDGSPAGTIWFVLVASLGMVAAIGGASLAMTGMMRLLRGVDSIVARFLASLLSVAALVFIGLIGYRVSKAPRAPKADAPQAQPREPTHRGAGGPRQAAERQRYDECVAYMRESYRRETLKACADELVAAWDSSHGDNKRFANMPDDGSFAGSIGALYASYAEATSDRSGALAGIRGLRERTQARYPGNTAALERLDGLAAELGTR